MVVANVVSEFQIGNAQIKIADNYCRKTACEVDRILKRIATQARFPQSVDVVKTPEGSKVIYE